MPAPAMRLVPARDAATPTLAELLGAADDWRADAACIGADPALFAPREEHEPRYTRYPERATTAAAYCTACPVRRPCAAYADRRRELGVWAGAWRTGAGRHYSARRITGVRGAA